VSAHDRGAPSTGADPFRRGYGTQRSSKNGCSYRRSERENRVIDHDQEGSMEMKKRAGYF